MSTNSETYFPTKFDIAIGGCFGPSFTVRLSDDKLMYEKSPALYSLMQAVEIKPTAEQWERFWDEVDQIGIWGWDSIYEQRSADGEDGNHWFVQIAHDDRSVISEGVDTYPGSNGPLPSKEFETFLTALRNLLGGVEFW